jgi:hypothetical protein
MGYQASQIRKHKKIQHFAMIFRLQPGEPTKSST